MSELYNLYITDNMALVIKSFFLNADPNAIIHLVMWDLKKIPTKRELRVHNFTQVIKEIGDFLEEFNRTRARQATRINICVVDINGLVGARQFAAARFARNSYQITGAGCPM